MTRRRIVLARLLACAVLPIAAGSLPAYGANAEPATPGSTKTPLVAAASDLQFALDEIVARFNRDTGITPRITYGSSGNFAGRSNRGRPSNCSCRPMKPM